MTFSRITVKYSLKIHSFSCHWEFITEHIVVNVYLSLISIGWDDQAVARNKNKKFSWVTFTDHNRQTLMLLTPVRYSCSSWATCALSDRAPGCWWHHCPCPRSHDTGHWTLDRPDCQHSAILPGSELCQAHNWPAPTLWLRHSVYTSTHSVHTLYSLSRSALWTVHNIIIWLRKVKYGAGAAIIRGDSLLRRSQSID